MGESLRYIAFLENEPVALSGWSSAAYKSRHRDEWIGWSEAQRHERLRFVANHARFLILPRFHLKNLASKLLSMNIKRLSNDWQSAYQMGRWAAQLPQFILKQFGCRYDDHQRKYTAPSDETLRRIFHATDGERIDLVIQQWLEATGTRTDVDRKVRQEAKHLLKHPEHRFSTVFARQCSRYARSVTDRNGVSG